MSQYLEKSSFESVQQVLPGLKLYKDLFEQLSVTRLSGIFNCKCLLK